MDTLPISDAASVMRTQPFEPDGRMPSDFRSVSEFIASGAFDEAVLRAGARGVARAVAANEALNAGRSAAGE